MGENPVVKKAPLSLEQFAFKQRVTDCSVCALPEAAREGISRARKKRIDRDTVEAWLGDEFGWAGTSEHLTLHSNGHHDRRLKELA